MGLWCQGARAQLSSLLQIMWLHGLKLLRSKPAPGVDQVSCDLSDCFVYARAVTDQVGCCDCRMYDMSTAQFQRTLQQCCVQQHATHPLRMAKEGHFLHSLQPGSFQFLSCSNSSPIFSHSALRQKHCILHMSWEALRCFCFRGLGLRCNYKKCCAQSNYLAGFAKQNKAPS